MGKKKKKKKKQRRQRKHLSVEQLESRARTYLETSRFGKARDCFKTLCKQDREKYLPGYIQAARDLFHQLMDNWRFSRARVALANLEKFAPGSEVHLEKIRLYIHQKNFPRAAMAATEALSEKGPSFNQADYPLGDAVVLNFEQISPSAALPDRLHADLGRIHSALSCVCEEKYDKALSLIKPICLRSLFTPWKWFIKGLCAFYRREDEKSVKAFEKVPAQTAPAKAARPYLLLLAGYDGLEKEHKKADVLENTCLLAGKKSVSKVVSRAEYLWRVGRFRDSYRHVLSKLDGFPSESTGLEQTLTMFYYNAFLNMDFSRGDKYLELLFDRAYKNRRNGLELILAHRAEALFLEKGLFPDHDVLSAWKDFLAAYQIVYGRNGRVPAFVYAHLGDIFSMEEPDIVDPFYVFLGPRRKKGPRLRNSDLAEMCYQQSLKFDSNGRETEFSLLSLYEKTGHKSKINRQLDKIIKQFPDEKDALFKAGVRCLERNALIKGMKYFERALELDPIDRALRENFIVACIKTGLKYVKDRHLEKCRKLLPKALERAAVHSDDFNIGRPYLYARWAAFELLGGRDENAKAHMCRAFDELKNNELKLHYFFYLISRIYDVDPQHLKENETYVKQVLSKPPLPKNAVVFAETLGYLRQFPEKITWLIKEESRISRYLATAAEADVSRQQARVVVEYALTDPKISQRVAGKYIDGMLKKKPEDALFRFFNYLVKHQDGMFSWGPQKDVEELKTILCLAENQRDAALAVKVRRMISELEEMCPVLDAFDGWPDHEMDDDDDIDIFPFPFPPDTKKPKSSPKREKGAKPPRQKQLSLFE